jgi:type IV secretion system protein VirB10
MSSDKTSKADGLPEIAQRLNENKPVVLGIVGIILIAGVGLFHFGKPNKKPIQIIHETFAVQQSSQIDKLPSVPTTPPVTNPVTPVVNPVVMQQQLELIQAKKNELQQRLSAPLMLVNNVQPNKMDALPSQTGVQSNDRNTQFMNQASAQTTETVNATTLGSLNNFIAEGSLIHAILETAANSDLPGYVRAVVSEPSYSEDGTHILIPQGSRLIGQYKSGMLQGQSRIFMVWTRLITPSGISIQLGSPGVDSLGVAGVGADEVDRHFWERFGTGSLLSIIGVGAANVGVSPTDQENSASAYRTAVANSFSQSANQALQQDSKIPPTLTINQGKPIIVFVAKDINFQNAMQKATPRVNIF